MQPEKAIIFGPIIGFFVIFGALIVGFLVVVGKLVMKGRASTWRGELIDKIYKTRKDLDTNRDEHFYTLVFKTEDGKTLKVGTSKDVYDT